MEDLYRDFANIEPYLLRLNFSNIEFHFDNIAWRRTNETQCFSGKFFLEQSNYDLVKNPLNVTQNMILELTEQIAANISQRAGRSVVRPRTLRTMIAELFRADPTFERDLIDSLGSFAVTNWAWRFSDALIAVIASTKPPNVTLPELPDNVTVVDFITNNFAVKEIVNNVSQGISESYFMRILQLRGTNIHMRALVYFINTTFRETIARFDPIRSRRLNVTNLIEDILDELFSDETLRRYFAWFMVPTSMIRYQRVYKYLENRFYKVFSDAIARSPGLSQFSHYLILKEALAAIHPSVIRAVLWNSYQRIAGSVTMNLALSNFTRLLFDQGRSRLSNATFYMAMVRRIYLRSFPLSINPNPRNDREWVVNGEDIKRVWERLFLFANEMNASHGNGFAFNSEMFPQQNDIRMRENIALSARRFLRLNFRMARFAEFSGDNKRVCATVFKHNLVREAIFNNDKFRYCLRVDDNYRSSSAAQRLGPTNMFKKHIMKIVEAKKSFYCAACSSKLSKEIDVDKNTISLSNDFCFEFVKKFRGYLNWRYRVFEIYQNTIYQFLSCYGRNANLTDRFPYPSWGGFLPNNFTEWRACSRVASVRNISQCTNVCNQIKLTNFSAWIEGDRRALQKLYNYAMTVMRMYGIQYGTYDVSRHAVNATSGRVRLLEERKRAVVYNLEPEPKKGSRKLASDAPASQPTNSSNPEGPFIPKPLLRMMEKSPTISLLYEIFTTVDDRVNYTRSEHYNHDEIESCKDNYEVSPDINDLSLMTTVLVNKGGLNLFDIAKKAHFEKHMLEYLTVGGPKKTHETLKAQIIKDCIVIHKRDIKLFNEDFGLTFQSKLIDPTPKISIPDVDDRLFARYRKNKRLQWETPPLEATHFLHRGDHHSEHHRSLRLEKNKQVKETKNTLSSTLSNMLFKVWF
jgi:hypothetical protein